MIILHIGTDKTGSTAIQKMLFWNKEHLNQNSWLYPESGMMHYDHARLKIALDNDDKEPFELLRKEIKNSGSEHLLLSHEGFYSLETEKILFLINFLESLNKGSIKVVLYVRRQDEMIESGILQQLKTNERIPSFDQMNEIPFHGYLDYYNILKKWENAIGNNTIDIRPYGKQFFTGDKTLYKDFSEASIEIPKKIFHLLTIPDRDQNPSLDAISAHVVSFLAKIGMNDINFDAIVDQLLYIQSTLSPVKSKLFSYEQRVQLLQKYESSNVKLADKLPIELFSLPESIKKVRSVTEKEVMNRMTLLYQKRHLLIGCKQWFGEFGFINRIDEKKLVLLSGFYNVEKWGIWTNGNEVSKLAFRVARTIANGNGILLTIKSSYLDSSNTKSFVRLEGSDKNWLEMVSTTELVIKPECIQKTAGVVTIEIKHQNQISPRNLNIGNDSRIFGCSLKGIGYEEMKERIS